MNVGWISLHRKLQECDIWLDDEPFDRRSAWIDLLLSANHEDKGMIFDGRRIVVNRGQLITSVRKLSAKWHWGKDKTLAYLRLLEELQMIERSADSRKTLLTIVNYDIYQNEDVSSRQSTDSQQTVSRHRPATNNNVNNENNDNKKNNIKGFVKPTVEEVRAYCQERKNTVDAERFVDFYEMKGWLVGKTKMKDWKAAVRTWEKRREGEANGSVGRIPTTDEERAIEEHIRKLKAGELDGEDEGLWD